jgi:hypothetical protein
MQIYKLILYNVHFVPQMDGMDRIVISDITKCTIFALDMTDLDRILYPKY